MSGGSHGLYCLFRVSQAKIHIAERLTELTTTSQVAELLEHAPHTEAFSDLILATIIDQPSELRRTPGDACEHMFHTASSRSHEIQFSAGERSEN